MVLLVSILLVSFFGLTYYVLKEKKKKDTLRELLASYLMEIQEEIDQLSFDKYLQKSWLMEQFVEEVSELYSHDKKVLKHLKLEASPDIFMLAKEPKLWLLGINDIYIENELKQYKKYFDEIESNPLTYQQRLAVVVHEKNNLILAGAGSGKTSVVVAKVGYLVKKEYAKKEEILVLAFNKKAQQELAERIKEKLGINVEVRTFHSFGKKVIDGISSNTCSDFSLMITDATKAIKNGTYISHYKYILIDEFQDISRERNEMIMALKTQNKNVNITVVGDDWQAINSFSGSDIGIIQNFESHYGDSETVKLDYTFRFNETIADVSQTFIMKNALQMQKEIKSVKPKSKNALYLSLYSDKKKIEESIEAILSFISKNIKEQKSVMILSRYAFYEPKNLNYFSEKYNCLNISFETIHGAKGLEADYVILTHMESGKFGFPSEQSVTDLDDYPYAEERRIFYVALTRAKEKLFFIANKKKPSVFIEEISREHELIHF
jgi:superfamily I DNA/RNA helicase